MLICLGCGAVFEAAQVRYEDSGEAVYVCVRCADYDLARAHPCVRCGAYFERGALIKGFCDPCANAIIKTMRRAVESLLDSFEADEAELLRYEMDL